MLAAPPPVLQSPAPTASAAGRPATAELWLDIAPQPLDSALEALAAQADLQLLYDQPIVRGLLSPGFRGRASIEAVLAQLLKGSGLHARVLASGDVILEPAEPLRRGPGGEGAPPQAPAKLRLDVLKVDPPTLGEEAGGRGAELDFGWYARLVEADIRRRLLARATRADHYRLVVDVWIDPAGAISKAHLAASSGDPVSDRTVAATLLDVKLEVAPPPGLAQPLHLFIRAQER